MRHALGNEMRHARAEKCWHGLRLPEAFAATIPAPLVAVNCFIIEGLTSKRESSVQREAAGLRIDSRPHVEFLVGTSYTNS